MTRDEARRAARAARLDWATVEATCRGLRQMAREALETDWAIRAMVWRAYAWSPACRPFWRIGMRRRFVRAFGDGDRTLIPGFDVVAQYVAAEFPELGRGDDPAEALFELLSRDCPRLPESGELWAQALELAGACPAETEVVPF